MEKQASITKLEIDKKVYYTKMFWHPNKHDLFHIKIFDGDKTWTGRYSHEFAKKFMERLDETEDEYYNNLKKGMSNHPDFVFALQTDDNSGSFSWKKKIEDSQQCVGHMVCGCVPIHRDETSESKDILLDFLLKENRDLRDTIDSLSAKNEELSVDLNKCKEDLIKFVDIKTTLETTLYGKFIQLLNAKKRRIQLLEDNITKISKPNKNMVGDELD